jgi:hypothetical protein
LRAWDEKQGLQPTSTLTVPLELTVSGLMQ